MVIRKATENDIPFIIMAILDIEKKGNTNTYNSLFSCDNQTTISYLKSIFEDNENIGTELSLTSFYILESDDTAIGCCSHIYTNNEYYNNKGELFTIHLQPSHLKTFIENAKSLPIQIDSRNKHFIEYVFISKEYRGRGLVAKLMKHVITEINISPIYINVFTNNEIALKSYEKLGFERYTEVNIDSEKNNIYPTKKKIIMIKNN